MGRFNKGLFLGGLLGAGLVWLNFTKKGKETREQLLDHAAVVYEQIKEKAVKSKTWKEMNKNQYVALVKETVEKYAIQNGLAENVKNMIIKVVSAQWSNLREMVEKEEK
jgi:gas vesicle protein